MSALTTAEEQFAQEIVIGNKNQSDAYRIAFPHRKWKESTIWSKASTLAAKGKVRERIEELRKGLLDARMWKREDSIRVLSAIAENGDKNSDKVRAVAELNEMEGYNAPQTVNHNVNVVKIELVAMKR